VCSLCWMVSQCFRVMPVRPARVAELECVLLHGDITRSGLLQCKDRVASLLSARPAHVKICVSA
jgi:hypothetical protein